MTTKKIFDMPKEPSYELEVLDLSHDSHASDKENARSDVWVWSEREHDDNLERLKETQQKFITKGKETRIVKVTRSILNPTSYIHTCHYGPMRTPCNADKRTRSNCPYCDTIVSQENTQ